MANRVHRTGNTLQEVAAAQILPGTFAFTSSGICKFYGHKGTDSQPIAAGALATPYVGGVTVLIDKADATEAYAVGKTIFGDTTLQQAVDQSVTPDHVVGDGVLGICAEASANGDLQVAVRLNEAFSADVVMKGVTTDFTDATSSLNVSGKYRGKQAFNVTTGRPVWSQGATDTSTWEFADGTTAHTPS